MRLRWGRTAVLTSAVAGAVALGAALSPAAGSAGSVTARAAGFGQAATVGALFTLTPDGGLGTHFCTASVVDSPRGDLVLTAAHCVSQASVGTVAFVPDYGSGTSPFGAWTVTRVVVDAQWSAAQDPDDDFAFLIVRQAGGTTPVQQLTGGEAIGLDEPVGGQVRVAGYPNSGDALVSCANTVLSFSPTQYQFNCGGFSDGTSGSPLLAGGAGRGGGTPLVIGVIGGYQKGGDTAAVSYAARFGTDLAGLYQQAVGQAGPG